MNAKGSINIALKLLIGVAIWGSRLVYHSNGKNDPIVGPQQVVLLIFAHKFIFVLNRLLLSCVFFLFLNMAFGQGTRNFPGASRGGSGGAASAPQLDEVEPEDTIPVIYFYADNPNERISFSDTVLHQYFQQYDPLRHGDVDYMNLGIFGSPYQPILFESSKRRGFDVGINNYSLYHIPVTKIPYFTLGQAYTNLYYTQGTSQSDANVGVQFSRNFANGINFSIDYKRISQLGTRVQYPNQNTRNTALTFGLWYHSRNGKYDGFWGYAANTNEQEENGGLASEPARDEQFSDPAAASVFLTDAQSRYQFREMAYTQYYKFGGTVDTLGQFKRAYTLSHQILYKNSIYKFFDNTVDTSLSSYYNQFLVDLRGLRHFIEHRKVENSFKVSTFKLDADSKLKIPRDQLEIGLIHTYHNLNQEPIDSNINNLFAYGKWKLRVSDRMELNTYAHFGLWDNAGDFKISGDLTLDFDSFGRLRVEAINQLNSPTLIQEGLFISQRQIWDNNFGKTLESSVMASYELPKVRLKVSGGYHLINNFIYFDVMGLAQQTGTPISILQLSVKKDFAFGPIHLDNVVSVQQVSEDFIRLPSLYTKNSLYYAGKWFKVLNVRFGFDLRWSNAFFSNYYYPIIGQFILQDETEIAAYPAVDGFFSMRVSKFRAFIKWENMTSVLITDRLFYQSAFYPNQITGIRFGIYWVLKG